MKKSLLDTIVVFCDDPLKVSKYDDFRGEETSLRGIKRFILSSKEDPDVGLASFDKALTVDLLLALHPPGTRLWFSTFEFDRKLLGQLGQQGIEHYNLKHQNKAGLFRNPQRLIFRVASPKVIETVGWPNVYGFAGTDLYLFSGDVSRWEDSLRAGNCPDADLHSMKNIATLSNFLDEGLSYIQQYGGEEDDLALYTKKLGKEDIVKQLEKASCDKGIKLFVVEKAGDCYWEKKRSGRLELHD